MAHFFAFFTLFHLSLTFFRPEVPFKAFLMHECTAVDWKYHLNGKIYLFIVCKDFCCIDEDNFMNCVTISLEIVHVGIRIWVEN